MKNLRTTWSLKIETRERVVHDHYVTVRGRRYDAEDLAETLDAVLDGDVTLDDVESNRMLLELGVVDSLGNRRWCSPALPGPNFNAFRDALHAGLQRARRIAREVRR